MKLKEIDYTILFELVKNSKISDRKLARILGVSQPTITRRRAILEKEDLLDYTAIPNLKKLNLEIVSFNFVSWKPEVDIDINRRPEEYYDRSRELLSKHPNLIFVSTGRGLGMTRIAISLHKDYSDYVKFVRQFKIDWGKYLAKFESFIVSLKSDKIVRSFTFKHISEYMKQLDMLS